jgi:predicted transcriptional regulator
VGLILDSSVAVAAERRGDSVQHLLERVPIPPELEARLARVAVETGRTVDQVAIDLLTSSIDHDEWFRAEVEKGRAAARAGRLIEHDKFAARMDRRYRD